MNTQIEFVILICFCFLAPCYYKKFHRQLSSDMSSLVFCRFNEIFSKLSPTILCFLFLFWFRMLFSILLSLTLKRKRKAETKIHQKIRHVFAHINVERVPGPQWAAGFSGKRANDFLRLSGLASGCKSTKLYSNDGSFSNITFNAVPFKKRSLLTGCNFSQHLKMSHKTPAGASVLRDCLQACENDTL